MSIDPFAATCEPSGIEADCALRGVVPMIEGAIDLADSTLITHFRLQEAFENPDGTKDAPHWDEWFPRDGHAALDEDEVRYLLIHLGDWSIAYDGDANLRDGDPRAGYRRIVAVRDHQGREFDTMTACLAAGLMD
jgi:hypothetical protein